MASSMNSEHIARRLAAGQQGWAGYVGAAVICGAAALLAAPLEGLLDIASLALLFMLAVVLAAPRFGRGPALLAAGLSVLLLNLLFVPPQLSLAVADERFLFTFAVMLLVGLVVGQLTAGLKVQAQAANEREQNMRSLYEMSRELGSALAPLQVAEIAGRFIADRLNATAALRVFGPDDVLRSVGSGLQATGQPDGPAHRVLPLQATMAVRGELAVRRSGPADWSADELRLLNTCATLLAGTLERIHYIDVAQTAALQVEGERLRNTLLAAISHDLRTPLASLVGLAESLQLTRPGPTAQQAEIAVAMAASARRMCALANNLLDMARLQSGTVRLDRQWQPLEEVVGTALAATAGLLTRHPVQVQLAEELPWVHVDAVLLERVLVNLLENAVKYTPAGTAIDITGSELAAQVELSVRDHGPGLPAGREDQLFQKFERGEREGATPGVGLGLALCRAIVEAHGGSIHAEPVPSGGARFVLRLPRGAPPPAPPAEEPTEVQVA